MMNIKARLLGEKNNTFTLGVRMLSPRLTPFDEMRSNSMQDEGGMGMPLDEDEYYILKKHKRGAFTLFEKITWKEAVPSLSPVQVAGISAIALGAGLGIYWLRHHARSENIEGST